MRLFKAPDAMAEAPVNAPRVCPNSSASSRFSGSALQFTATILMWPRGLAVWIALATTSLPVPVSPLIRTVQRFGPTRRTVSATVSMARLSPISEARQASAGSTAALSRRRRRRSSEALSNSSRKPSILSPGPKQFHAPARTRRTASAAESRDEITITGISGVRVPYRFQHGAPDLRRFRVGEDTQSTSPRLKRHAGLLGQSAVANGNLP